MKKICHTVLLVLLSSQLAFSQALPNIVLSQISEENGLSDNHVQAVLKDKEGLVWIGTADGLNLLDGSTIKIFRHKEADSTSLFSNAVSSLAEDSDGNIWMGTSLGLSCYVKKLKHFVNTGLTSSPYGAANIVNSIAVDQQNRVWCGSDGGLYMYDPRKKITTAFFNKTNGESLGEVNKITNLLYDKEANLWLCTFEGLWRFDTKQHFFQRAVGKSNDKNYEGLTNVVFIDRQERLWFGNWSMGLKQLNRNSGTVSGYAALPNAVTNVIGINEIDLPNGKSVLCINGMLNMFDANANEFSRLPKPLQLNSEPFITHFYRAADGWMWMCSDKGVFIYNPQRQFFQQRFLQSDITSQNVIFSEWGNQILIGAQGKGFLIAYDEQWNIKNDFSNLAKKAAATGLQLADESSLGLLMENDHTFLINNTAGIIKYDVEKNTLRWFRHLENDSSSIPRNFIQHAFIDSKKQYWIFAWREGIYTMDTNTGKCRLRWKGFIQQQNKTKGLLIADVAEDDQGNLWMSDPDEGIILFDRNTQQFSKPFEKQIGSRARSERVIYRNGYCYSYANEKLLKWNTAERVLQVFSLPDPNINAIVDIILDQQNNWWIATKKGIFAFTEKHHAFKQFTVADGLFMNDMNGVFYAKHNGAIIFCSPSYFTTFNPEALLHSSFSAATIIVTGVEANGTATAYDSAHTLQFDHTTNNLLFRWAITDYVNPLHNQYYCKLQGIDAGWKYVGNKGEIQYASLSPGNYVLLLKAETSNGIAPEKIITIHFKITPPFWRTNWFWLLCLTAAAAIIFFLVNRYIRNLKTKAAINQQMSELEMKALRAQMNPHFIFNSLNSIQECIVSKNTDAAYNYLSQFSKLVRRILENSGKETVPLKEEQELMQWYLSLEQLRFTDEFTFSITNNCSNSMVEIPSMIIQPFIENALWHGLINKKGEKNIALIFNDDKDGITIQIIDNGIGRKAAALVAHRPGKQSMGLHITKERLQYYSHASSIEIIDLFNESAAACGTKVIIHLPNN